MGIWGDLAPWFGVVSVVATYLVCILGATATGRAPWPSIAGAHCGITICRIFNSRLPVGASTVGIALGLISDWRDWESAVWVPLAVGWLAVCTQIAFGGDRDDKDAGAKS
jgi:hypothetical protein